ncbi:hypothetical protein [Celeribacter marinus]|uniref:hypothetical protein n=1 Tax=Celeribacter marinus TaxID=1397108 RepID=UPI000781FCA9|nr:hypothetical protein [Celeribacter marinus]SFL02495.1 hypothetical protein SAMN05444421_11340 [Celeribacter marinus]
MARDQKTHASDKEVPVVPPGAVSFGASPCKVDQSLSQHLRIMSCLQAIAILLEKNDAYLPIFLRLEKELEIEQAKRDTIERARRYLPRQPH